MTTHSDVTKRIQEMMKTSGAHLEGHFKLTSGLHSGHYVQCALMLRYPKFAEYAGEKLAEIIEDFKPDFILSPALGGLIIGHEVARALNIPFIFCERKEGIMQLRRFPVPSGKKFVMIEDVVTTGKSSYETAQILVEKGCKWVGSGSIIDRRAVDIEDKLNLRSLWKVSFPVYTEDDCPICREGNFDLVKPGSRPDSKK